MRVVHYIPDFGLGGVQKAGCVLAERTAHLGHPSWVLADATGPRFQTNPKPPLTHGLIKSNSPDEIADELLKPDPQVIHIHAAAYREGVVERLSSMLGNDIRSGKRVIVSTPVFGRPPLDAQTLERTRTCCVGLYTFYRLCRWLNLSSEQAIAKGLAYVPLTPYAPATAALSANDPADAVARRRSEFGIAPGAFVVGRIGRNDPGKWHPLTEGLIDALLASHPSVIWLSVGLPDARGALSLAGKWGTRIISLPETPDYERLTRILSCMDVQVFFSSNGECFASSIAEAAGAGVPTIALAKPLKDNGQAEQVIEGVTGTLVASPAGAAAAIRRWIDNPGALATLKQSTEAHAHSRWHVDRVTENLLSLYDFWRQLPPGAASLPPTHPPYVQQMLHETDEFAKSYRSRMISLMGTGPIGRVKWRLLMAAVESWSVFRAGRFLKRLRHPAPAP